ncbi:hypothetical protein KDL45_17875, partial [bacterium]|nr:hypothetical protein [bacterium]
FLFVVIAFFVGCSHGGAKATDGGPTGDDDASDDDTSSDDDSSVDDDTLDDDDTTDDDDTYECLDSSPVTDDDFDIPCPNGFRIPDDADAAGGCITQVFGGLPGYFGTSIQVGPDGTRYVATAVGREIVVYSLPGDAPVDGEWDKEIVAHLGGTPINYYTNSGPKIIVDNRGVRHLAWYDLWGQRLMYARSEGKDCGWLIQVADDQHAIGASPDLAIDQEGHVHIASHSVAHRGVYYTTNKAGVWETEKAFDNGEDIGICTDIDIAQDGTVYLLVSNDGYEDPPNQYLLQKIDDWESIGGFLTGTSCGQFVVAGDGSLRISVDNYLYGAGVFSNATGEWTYRHLKNFSYDSAVAIDDSDAAYVAYTDPSFHLAVATDASGMWKKDVTHLG